MTLGRTVGSIKSNADRARGHQRVNGRGGSVDTTRLVAYTAYVTFIVLAESRDELAIVTKCRGTWR